MLPVFLSHRSDLSCLAARTAGRNAGATESPHVRTAETAVPRNAPSHSSRRPPSPALELQQTESVFPVIIDAAWQFGPAARKCQFQKQILRGLSQWSYASSWTPSEI